MTRDQRWVAGGAASAVVGGLLGFAAALAAGTWAEHACIDEVGNQAAGICALLPGAGAALAIPVAGVVTIFTVIVTALAWHLGRTGG